VTRECLRLLQARLTGAALSLGTFFVAADKESTSPVGANTHYQQLFRMGKSKKMDCRATARNDGKVMDSG